MIAHAVCSGFCFGLLNRVIFEKGKNISFSEQAGQELAPAEQLLRDKIATVFTAGINLCIFSVAILAESYFSLQNSLVFHMYTMPYPILTMGLSLYILVNLVSVIISQLFFSYRLPAINVPLDPFEQRLLNSKNSSVKNLIYEAFQAPTREEKKKNFSEIHSFVKEGLSKEEYHGFLIFLKETIFQAILDEKLVNEDFEICQEEITSLEGKTFSELIKNTFLIKDLCLLVVGYCHELTILTDGNLVQEIQKSENEFLKEICLQELIMKEHSDSNRGNIEATLHQAMLADLGKFWKKIAETKRRALPN